MSTCTCQVRRDYREFKDNLVLLDELVGNVTLSLYFEDLYARLESAETERNLYKMKYEDLKEDYLCNIVN